MMVCHGIEIVDIFEQIRKTLGFVTKYEQVSDFITPVKLVNEDNLY